MDDLFKEEVIMRRIPLLVSTVAAWLSFAGLASSSPPVEVYLNGVQITGAKDQVIEKAKVVLDKSGNVYITAPEYKVQELGHSSPGSGAPPSATATTAHLTKKYYVVTDITKPGVTGYTIQVIVNNKFLKDLPDSIPQNVLELNNYLNEGTNTVSFRAIRPAGASAKSTEPSDAFSLVLGEGKGDPGGQLVIDDILAEFKVTAIDTGEKAQTFTIRAR
jgi:hypothetical protein